MDSEKDLLEKPKKKPREKNLDRTGHKYSNQDFRMMRREEQLKFAKELRYKKEDKFDQLKLFQFSKTTFGNICKELGFIDSVIDSVIDSCSKNAFTLNHNVIDDLTIIIDRNKERDLCERKYRLQKSTCVRLDKTLDGLSNVDKSIVIDAIVIFALDTIDRLKENDSFKVIYPATQEKRLI